MARTQEIEKIVVREFEVLLESHGFGAPVVTREGWTTRVDFAKGDIGVELELDWRDVVLSILVVRLDNRQLPKGYYIEAGRACRKHLVNVARERKWPNAPAAPLRVRPSRALDPKDLMESARTKRDLVMGWLDRLEAEWQEIWQ